MGLSNGCDGKENGQSRMAILIDSENVSCRNIEFIMKESIRYGFLTIKRIYGDWTTQSMNSWKKVLPDYAIQPVQQFKNTAGKNSTDSALIIDAMDVLYSGAVDGFIIVSSDSDYTKLAVRLRESGKIVVGIGEKKTPKSLVNACNEFRYIEILAENYEGIKKELTQKTVKNEIGANGKQEDDDLLQHLIEAYEMIEQESEWKNLSTIANNLKLLDPAFTPKTYGFSQLSRLMESYREIFELRKDTERRTIKVRKCLEKPRPQRSQSQRRRKNPRVELANVVTEIKDSVPANVENNESSRKTGGLFPFFRRSDKQSDCRNENE